MFAPTLPKGFKLTRDEDSTEAREDVHARAFSSPPAAGHPAFDPLSIYKVLRQFSEDQALQARTSGSDVEARDPFTPPCGGCSAGMIQNPAAKYLKARDEDSTEAREDVYARIFSGAAPVPGAGLPPAVSKFLLNKVVRQIPEDLQEARGDEVEARYTFPWVGKPIIKRAIEELLERDDVEYMEARELFENYLEARDYELEDLE